MIQTALLISIRVFGFLSGKSLRIVTIIEKENGQKHLLQLCPTFHPGMSHQIFCDEKITGVKNPHIDIYFNPSTCDVAFLFIIHEIDVCGYEV